MHIGLNFLYLFYQVTAVYPYIHMSANHSVYIYIYTYIYICICRHIIHKHINK